MEQVPIGRIGAGGGGAEEMLWQNDPGSKAGAIGAAVAFACGLRTVCQEFFAEQWQGNVS